MNALKVGAMIAIEALIFWSGWHLGGLSSKAAAETVQAKQLAAVAAAYQSQVLATQTSMAKLKSVEDAYDAIKDAPDPVTTGLAQRVLYAACPSSGGHVSQTPAVAGRAPASGTQPRGDSGLEGRFQAVLDACSADAAQLNAIIELAPQ